MREMLATRQLKNVQILKFLPTSSTQSAQRSHHRLTRSSITSTKKNLNSGTHRDERQHQGIVHAVQVQESEHFDARMLDLN